MRGGGGEGAGGLPDSVDNSEGDEQEALLLPEEAVSGKQTHGRELDNKSLRGSTPGGGIFRMVILSHPPPDVCSYNFCIAACRRGGQPGLARLFFLEMMSRGLRPDVKTFKSMLLDGFDVAVDSAVPPTPTQKESSWNASKEQSADFFVGAAAHEVTVFGATLGFCTRTR